jgi:hypothetical protein
MPEDGKKESGILRPSAFRMTQGLEAEQKKTERNLESRARNARCNWTLTFVLALTGRGDRERHQIWAGIYPIATFQPSLFSG